MPKIVVMVLGAILAMSLGFVAGWVANSHYASTGAAPRPPVTPVAKEDEFEFWRYRGATQPEYIQVGPNYISTFSTTDGLDKVAGWYGERLGVALEPDKIGGPGGFGGGDLFAAVCNDSFQPQLVGGANPPRAGKIGVGSRWTTGSSLTVMVNHLDGEDRTHIVLCFNKR